MTEIRQPRYPMHNLAQARYSLLILLADRECRLIGQEEGAEAEKKLRERIAEFEAELAANGCGDH